jgi:hypothetical protein
MQHEKRTKADNQREEKGAVKIKSRGEQNNELRRK